MGSNPTGPAKLTCLRKRVLWIRGFFDGEFTVANLILTNGNIGHALTKYSDTAKLAEYYMMKYLQADGYCIVSSERLQALGED